MEILPFLIAPFLASLILTGIHAYLGVHVVESEYDKVSERLVQSYLDLKKRDLL